LAAVVTTDDHVEPLRLRSILNPVSWVELSVHDKWIELEGRVQQDAVRTLLGSVGSSLFKDRDEFERALDGAARRRGIKLTASVKKAILSAGTRCARTGS
jgi:hypothetical protein